MVFRVGIENNNEGYRSIAWTLEHPGCFAYGADGEAAFAALPAAIRDYAVWIAGREKQPWLTAEGIELRLEETWTDYSITETFDRDENSDHYTVDAWFQHDWKPLTALEIERGLKMLRWSRADLLKVVENLGAEKLDQTYPGERWSISGILRHIGGAEWWYLDRLGLALPGEQFPDEPFARLEVSQAQLDEVLPTLESVNKVAGVAGEFWSPRKVLRRALWHGRDHIEHIKKLL